MNRLRKELGLLATLLRQTREEFERVLWAHEFGFVATVGVLIALDWFGVDSMPWLSLSALVAVAPFAMLAQAETINAHSRPADVFGPWGRDFVGYCIDGAFLALLALAAAVAALIVLRPPASLSGALIGLSVIICVGPLATARLCLKLAARACHDRRGWSTHFALTRGHGLLLAGGLWAILAPFALAMLGAGTFLAGFWVLKSIVMNALSALAVLALACHTAVCYRTLIRTHAEPTLALPAPSP